MSWVETLASVRAASRARVGPATARVSMPSPDGKLTWRGVMASPVDLHRDAGIDRDLYAIARCVASEVGDGNPAACLALAEACRNAAADKGVQPYHYIAGLTSDAYAYTRWHYGEQHGRKVSTSRDPSERTLRAAQLARGAGFVGGAIRWFTPSVQDKGTQGARTLTYDAIGIVAKWGAEGLAWVGPLPGIDSYREALFLRRASGPVNVDAALAMIRAGRAGRPLVGTPGATDPLVATVLAVGLIAALV